MDYGVAVNIRTTADTAAATQASGAVQDLTKATNNVIPAQEKFAAASGVSRREIKVLTAELLRSVGAHAEAGAAGRVAAEGFAVLASGAGLANLAMAAVGLAVVGLVPLFERLAGATKAHQQETEAQTREITAQLPHLEKYVELMGKAAGAAERQLAATRDLVIQQQKDRVAGIDEEIKKLNEGLPKVELWTQRHLSQAEALQSLTVLERSNVGVMTEEQKRVQELKDKIAALSAERLRLNEAIARGDTVEHLEETRSEGAKKRAADQKRAIEEHMKDLKRGADYARGQEEQAIIDLSGMTKRERDEYDKDQKAKAEASAKKLMDEDIYNHKMRELEQQRYTAMVQGIAAGLGYLGDAFGKNKAIRAAGAAVDTYAAADSALAEVHPTVPAGVIAAAAVVAKGLAQVANIEKMGFDDPVSDMFSREAGRRWARDMVNNARFGFRETLQSERSIVPASSHSTTRIDQGITVQHLHAGAYFDSGQTDSLLRLSRALNKVNRTELRSTVSSGA